MDDVDNSNAVAQAETTSFFSKNWRQIVKDISEATTHVHPSCSRSRLLTIKSLLCRVPDLLTQPDILSVLPTFLGEVILSVKETSHKARDSAFEVLVSLGHRMSASRFSPALADLALSPASSSSSDPLMSEYICMIAGGLAGTSPHMQSATVLALARILYEFRNSLAQEIIREILVTVLPLFTSKSRELIKSLLGFVKVCILSLQLELLTQHLPKIISNICEFMDEKQNRFKAKIRILFEILIRKFSYEQVKIWTPNNHHPLLEHIRKQKEKERKQKAEAWKAKQTQRINNNKNKQADLGHDFEKRNGNDFNLADDDEDDDMSGNKQKKRVNNNHNKSNPSLLIKGGDVDFLDRASVVKGVVSAQSAHASNRKRRELQVDETGKILVSEDNTVQKKRSSSSSDGKVDLDDIERDLQEERRAKKRKGQHDDEVNEYSEDDSDNDGKKPSNIPGSQFRSNKGKGDVKRSGQMDPYAFVPLDPLALNRRKKVTVQRRLASVINAAKAGSDKASAFTAKKAIGKYRRGNKAHKK